MKLFAPATERNRGPILSVLEEHLRREQGALVLEIASGTGEHAAFFSGALADVTWQPTDVDPQALASIAARVAESENDNLLSPLRLDVHDDPWPVDHADGVVCINLLHISPVSAMHVLFRGASTILPPGGVVYLYGPFNIDGGFISASNARFDASLRRRDPRWGIRDVAEVREAAADQGLSWVARIPMPANNQSLIFRRSF